ncbi:hypothetical protein POVWA1_013570 [Plasmodium ovale wallikeri]|uniref:Uncharacterized protein n=1 Tax=Plasmodium ovale wallikeri TaxID=864142 RepID=A0A1A8YMF1_PLAOA|nr:hypothetical protein POVWA1_013570 [Plasmodium ovale wallikeri]
MKKRGRKLGHLPQNFCISKKLFNVTGYGTYAPTYFTSPVCKYMLFPIWGLQKKKKKKKKKKKGVKELHLHVRYALAGYTPRNVITP